MSGIETYEDHPAMEPQEQKQVILRCFHCHIKLCDRSSFLDHLFDKHGDREISVLLRVPADTGPSYRSVHYGIRPCDIEGGKEAVEFVDNSLSLALHEFTSVSKEGSVKEETCFVNPVVGTRPLEVRSPSPHKFSPTAPTFVFENKSNITEKNVPCPDEAPAKTENSTTKSLVDFNDNIDGKVIQDEYLGELDTDSTESRGMVIKPLGCDSIDDLTSLQIGIADHDIQEYRAAFDSVTKDGDGTMSRPQLKEAMQKAGAEITDTDLQALMESMDRDGNDVIDVEEFIEMIECSGSTLEDVSPEAELKESFKVFDRNGDGRITRDELRATMHELGEHLSDDDIDAMFSNADKNGDGVIDYEEFVQMMSGRFSHTLDYTSGGKFTEEQLADLKVAFNLLDKDKDGTITKDELKVVMVAFQQSVTDNELDEIFSKVDLDRNGRIDFKEFLTMLEDRMKVQSEDAEMRQAFKVFDRDNNGYIDSSELRRTMDDLGVKLTNKDVDSMMAEAGVGKSKRIYYEDFVKMMYGKLPIGSKMSSVNFTREQVTEFKVSFALFDKDGDGFICLNELRSVMKSLGQAPSEDMLKKMFNKVDTDGNGLIDFDEFVDILERKKLTQPQDRKPSDDSEMRAVFKAFDKDGNGYVDSRELKSTMKELGLDLTGQDVRAMMSETGVKDGRIFYEDFVKMMYGKIGNCDPREIEESPRPADPLTPSSALSQQQLAELQVAFSMFDKDGDGRITALELQSVMKSLGVHTSFDKIKEMLNIVDKDGNGTIEFDEFQELMENWLSRHQATSLSHPPLDPESDALKAFNVFDKDGNGFIDQKELQYTMKKLGVVLSDDDTALMLKEADLDGDGLINFTEFQRLMAGDFTQPNKVAQTSKLQEYKEAFKLFDKDNDGYIDVKELGQVASSLGMNCTQKQIVTMITRSDKKRIGKVSFNDFLAMMTRRRLSLALGHKELGSKGDAEMCDSFRVFDLDGDGYITAAELKHAMKKLGEEITDTDVDSMIQEADLDGDGKIDFPEFKRMMSAKT